MSLVVSALKLGPYSACTREGRRGRCGVKVQEGWWGGGADVLISGTVCAHIDTPARVGTVAF